MAACKLVLVLVVFATTVCCGSTLDDGESSRECATAGTTCWVDTTLGGQLGIEYPCCGYPEYYCDKPNLKVCVKRTTSPRSLMASYNFNLQDEPPVSQNRESPIGSEGRQSVSELQDDLEDRRFAVGNYPSRPMDIPVSEDKLVSGKSDQEINRPPSLRSQPIRIPISLRAFASLNLL